MLYFVLAAVLAVAIVIGTLMALFGKKESEFKSDGPPAGKVGKWVVAGSVFAIIFTTFAFSFHTTPARSTDIAVSFGKYVDTYQSGPRLTDPWISTETFSTQVQPLKLDGGKDDGHKDVVNVNFSDGGQGSTAVTVTWQITPDKAKKLWERHRSFDKVRDDLVDASVRSRIREVIGAKTAVDALKGSNLEPMGKAAEALLKQDFEPYGVEVVNVRITNVSVDGKTQENLQGLIAAGLAEQKALSEKRRANTEKETTKIRKESGQLTPEANQRYCLDIMAGWDHNKSGDIPAGYNCNGTQSGVGVLVTK